MSGIVGSSHNIRGSGVVAKLGTDGQVFTSAGAGIKQTYEAAAGGSNSYAEITQAVNQGITSDTWVKIANMTATLDSASKWDTTNDKYVVPSDGRYFVRLTVYTNHGTNNLGYCAVRIYVDQAEVVQIRERIIGSAEGEVMAVVLGAIMDLDTDEELEFYTYLTPQDSNTGTAATVAGETGNSTQGTTSVQIIGLI